MKAVLISIQPKWCEPIASGEKTIEVRKTRPKLETPFKVYIYCSDSSKDIFYRSVYSYDDLLYTPKHKDECKRKLTENGHFIYNGKIIGEFVCDKIIRLNYSCGSYRCEGLNRLENDRIASASQLSLYDMRNYLSCNGGYAWHISDLVIYDEPKKLGGFFHACDKTNGTYCSVCVERRENKCKSIKRAPQSWCYVEEVSS